MSPPSSSTLETMEVDHTGEISTTEAEYPAEISPPSEPSEKTCSNPENIKILAEKEFSKIDTPEDFARIVTELGGDGCQGHAIIPGNSPLNTQFKVSDTVAVLRYV